MSSNEKIILALDVPSKDEMLALLAKINAPGCYVKVGMELYYQEGADIVRALKASGYRVFLDLKLHDIPNTVRRAMRGLARVGADMVNVHAAGGSVMMRAAAEGLAEGAVGKRPICLAVTQLTSTSQEMLESEILIQQPIVDVIQSYASLAARAGMDGVVCSAWEAAAIKRATSSQFLAVTPGIRLAKDAAGDQKRVATPGRARTLGSDYIVVGRSITAASDPAAAYRQVVEEWGNTEWKTDN
ncbi:orotidine-5'-phosphate decarboxylase [Sporolactobacillus spathodeae]|uniref:Orotidine 5'-phosphate decarboxylase n=1 Tax=Sporolactobacillus spathodeae TaxID=1465502 RepID=A0ABS2Q909_9BACL|nr:orotidine-5'-phosphate decarboxylase [Sporolactobacillus spathodeae]MBM7658264.1 orotidine-5'-phosphate decarboxylase [Sporolactobacillus spathodeae]